MRRKEEVGVLPRFTEKLVGGVLDSLDGPDGRLTSGYATRGKMADGVKMVEAS
jgi:hypothetical protein